MLGELHGARRANDPVAFEAVAYEWSARPCGTSDQETTTRLPQLVPGYARARRTAVPFRPQGKLSLWNKQPLTRSFHKYNSATHQAW